jgi:Spy/CpxP family protein refolding chaperone
MNKSILLTGATLATLSLFAATTFAATSNGTIGLTNKIIQSSDGTKGRHRPMIELTDTEKTALTSMSDTDKRVFFDQKHTEMKAKHEVYEAIIDKLLAGQALTADEEILRKMIITERASKKAKKTQMKAILDKKKTGTALTDDEQKLLDSMTKIGRHHSIDGRGPEPKDTNDNDIETDDGPDGR